MNEENKKHNPENRTDNSDKEPADSRTHCIRCGECCLNSSPTLQMPDLSEVLDGHIRTTDLYTIRVGELVWDNIQRQMRISDREVIKLKEKEGSKSCLFYNEDENACAIYEHRPIQCRALACWDDSEFMRVYQRPKADRKDLIRNSNLLKLIDEHNKKCSYLEIDRWVRQIEDMGEGAVERILGLLKYDHDLRAMAFDRLNIKYEQMDFLFGRPLSKTITMFGLKVVREKESFCLTVDKKGG